MEMLWNPWSSVSEGRTVPGGTISAVRLFQELAQFALFVADHGGGIYTTLGSAQSGWGPWATVSEGHTMPGAPVTAVEPVRQRGRFALFVADHGGGVYTTLGSPQSGWGPWATVSEGHTMPGAPVTAVELLHQPGQFAVFVADPGGGVYVVSGSPEEGWGLWSTVSEGHTMPGARVTAVRIGTGSLPQTRIALFVADPGGGVFTASGSPDEGWSPWSSVSEGRTTPGGPITAVPFGTRQDQIALFLADRGGEIFTTAGSAESGWLGWSNVPGIRTVPGAPVAAVELHTSPGRFALFLADTNGSIFTTSGHVGARWDAWSSVPAGRALPGAPVSAGALPVVAAGVAVFVADPGGSVVTTSGRAAPPVGPTDLKVTGVADRSIAVAWIDRSTNEEGFRVRFHGTRAAFEDDSGTTSVGRNVLSAVLTGLRSGYSYTISVVAFNDGGNSPSSNEVRATTPARQIAVTSAGTGESTVFTVTGAGFTPNGHVVIRVSSSFNQLQFPQSADSDGKFVSRHAVACTSGLQLTFTAFEDADPLGTFANDVVTTCP